MIHHQTADNNDPCFSFQDDLADKAIKLTARERRFIKFASVEFDGQIYMTPQVR